MANLKIKNINKNFGITEVLKGINLDMCKKFLDISHLSLTN